MTIKEQWNKCPACPAAEEDTDGLTKRDALIVAMAGPMFAKALSLTPLDDVTRKAFSMSIIECADSLIDELQRRDDQANQKPPVVREDAEPKS